MTDEFKKWWPEFRKRFPGWATQVPPDILSQIVFEAAFKLGQEKREGIWNMIMKRCRLISSFFHK
jgi:hypothetical protein